MPRKYGYGYGFKDTALAKGRKQLKEFRKRTKPVPPPVKPTKTTPTVKPSRTERPPQPVKPGMLKELDKDIAELEKTTKPKKKNPLNFSKPAAYGGSD